MRQVIGFANSAGTRITAVALARVQSRTSGVATTEQTRTRAVSIISSIAATWPRTMDTCHAREGYDVMRVTYCRNVRAPGALLGVPPVAPQGSDCGRGTFQSR